MMSMRVMRASADIERGRLCSASGRIVLATCATSADAVRATVSMRRAVVLGVDPVATAAGFAEIARGKEIAVPGAVRASIGVGVSSAQIDRLVDALEQIATGS